MSFEEISMILPDGFIDLNVTASCGADLFILYAILYRHSVIFI